MSKKKPEAPKPQEVAPVEPTAPDYPECLPEMHAVTKYKVGKRWQIVHVAIQGDKVIRKESVGPPQISGLAANEYKRESIKAHPEIL